MNFTLFLSDNYVLLEIHSFNMAKCKCAAYEHYALLIVIVLCLRYGLPGQTWAG